MRRPRVAVDAAVLAALVRIDRLRERDVGRIVARDDRARALDRRPSCGAWRAALGRRARAAAAPSRRRPPRAPRAGSGWPGLNVAPRPRSAGGGARARRRRTRHRAAAAPVAASAGVTGRVVDGTTRNLTPRVVARRAGSQNRPPPARRCAPRSRDATPMTKPKTHALRHAVAARRRAARSGDRRARDADLPDGVVRVPRQRPRGGALQHGARGPRLLAHLQPDRARCSRSASPRSKAASARSRRRAGRRRCTSRSSRCWARARTSSRRASLYGGSHNLLDYTLPRFGIDDDVRRSARPRRVARGDPAGDAAAVRRDARQPGPRRARHPARGGARARARRCRCSSTRRSPRRS